MGSPTVPGNVRAELEEARRCGVSFDDAWTSATSDLPGGYTTTDSWAYALQATRQAWQAAYEGRPAQGDVRSVEKLYDLWLAA